MNPLSELRAFVKVAELHSFAAAAASFGLTPSALSKLVSRLEDRLGVRLLHRTTRRLGLTTEGELYFTRARRILADIADLESEVVKSRGAPRGRLRINTSNGFGVQQLAPALPDFLARYPEIEIELAITDRIIDLVNDPCDMAVRVARDIETPLFVRHIANVERIICAAPSYLARRGTPMMAADLAQHDCIAHSPTGPHRWPFRTANGVEFLTIAPRLVTDNAECGLKLAIAGGGVIRIGDAMVGAALQSGALVPLLTKIHDGESFPLSAICLAERYRLPKVRVFLDFLVERFGSAPWRLKLA